MKLTKNDLFLIGIVSWFALTLLIASVGKISHIVSTNHPTAEVIKDIPEDIDDSSEDGEKKSDNGDITEDQLSENRKAIQKHIGENYLDAILDEGGLVRWNPRSFPLKIYIDNNIQLSYIVLIKKAFSTWQEKTGNFINFKYITDVTDADFVVSLPTKLKNRNCSENGMGVAAYQYFTFKDKQIDKSNIEVSLYDCKDKLFPTDVFYKVMLHEIGHGLGLRGHSTNPNDLMYPIGNGTGTISEADMTTLRAIYSIIPDITNMPFTEEDKENLITTNDVWGNNANKFKMEQIKENLKITPTDQNGYQALARGYAKNKEYSKAIQEYENALQYTDNDKDAYNIYIAVSFVYVEADQLEDAEKILKKASSYFQDDSLANAYNNLACTYIKNKNYDKAKELLSTGLQYAQKNKKMFYNNFCYIAAETNDINLYNKYKVYLE